MMQFDNSHTLNGIDNKNKYQLCQTSSSNCVELEVRLLDTIYVPFVHSESSVLDKGGRVHARLRGILKTCTAHNIICLEFSRVTISFT